MSQSTAPGMTRLPGWVAPTLVGGTYLALLWLEHRRPLRKGQVEPKLRRTARNLAVAGLSAVAVTLAETPVTTPLTRIVERRRWGLLQRLPMPRPLRTALAVLLMDYTLYLWHVLTHKAPLLWRFHQVHHVDLDMDTSTGLRFHFGEMLMSVIFRAGQILVIGVSPLALSIYYALLLPEVLFHHSNVQLPARLERWLSRIIVTPRMHGVHHSIVPEEQNSNWSSGLIVWDWLHGTLRRNVPQDQIVIGVPAYRDPKELTLPKVLEMPFDQQRDPWRLPDDTIPARSHRLASKTTFTP